MKAVILAGGNLSGPRPMTVGRPQSVLPLFGKPLLGHTLDLLRRHGVTEIAVTLGPSPNAVMDRFGGGGEYGVKLTWFVENVPLGTAGGLRPCREFLEGEDFLVIPGDGVGDLDLSALQKRHRTTHAAATLALSRGNGTGRLARTEVGGRVLALDDTPPVAGEARWEGVCVLSPRCLELLPAQGPWDLAQELVPALLGRDELVFVREVEGGWYTLDQAGAYLDCLRDALAGKLKLDLDTGRTPPPTGAEVRQPCWLGQRVTLAPGCIIGPYTVLGENSTVETGAVVERSALLGASVGEGAEVSGAILCKGSSLHRRSVVSPGAVLGEGSVVGADAIVAPGVRLWPGRRVPEGGRATSSQVLVSAPMALKFSEGGALRGIIGEEMTPEALLALGSLLGQGGQVGVGWWGGSSAAMLGRAALCGVTAAGAMALVGDAPCPSAQSWLARRYRLPVSLFIGQDGDSAALRLFGPDGLPLDRSCQRRLEGALLRGEGSRVPAARVGEAETVHGVRTGYVAEAARLCRQTAHGAPVTVRVERGEVNDVLCAALTTLGCTVVREGRGLPVFSADLGGFRLSAWDEEGRAIPYDRLYVLLTRVEMERGEGQVALPSWSPAAADQVAAHFGGKVLRLGRDKGAYELWRATPWMWDGIFAACRLCAHLAAAGESLTRLDRSVPRFATAHGEVPLRTDRGKTLEALAAASPAAQREGRGVRLPVGVGWVYLAPMTRRAALRVIAEATDAETARELCRAYEERIKELDGDK